MAEQINDPVLGLMFRDRTPTSSYFFMANKVAVPRFHGEFHISISTRPEPPIEYIRAKVAWLNNMPEELAQEIERGLFEYYNSIRGEYYECYLDVDPDTVLERVPEVAEPSEIWQVYRPALVYLDDEATDEKYDTSLDFDPTYDEEHRAAAMLKRGVLVRVGDEGVGW